MVCLVFLDSLDQRETQESQVALALPEILEISDPQAHLETQVYLQPPLW